MKYINKHIEMFIEAVRRRPQLYDPNHPDHKMAKRKMDLWREIADEVEMQNCHVAKSKWRNLRDCYLKWRRRNTDEKYSRYASWPWGEKLDFLSVTLTGTSKSHESNNESTSSSRPSLSRTGNQKKPTSEHKPIENIIVEKSQSPITFDHIKTENDNVDFDDDNESTKSDQSNYVVLDHVKNKPEQVPPRGDIDHVDNLFLSYANTFKKMSKHSQVGLKLKMAQIFAEAEMQELNSSAQMDM